MTVVKGRRPTRQMVLRALKGRRLEELLIRAETADVTTSTSAYKEFRATGRIFIDIVAVKR